MDRTAQCGSVPRTFATGQDLTIGLGTTRQNEVTLSSAVCEFGLPGRVEVHIGTRAAGRVPAAEGTGRMPMQSCAEPVTACMRTAAVCYAGPCRNVGQ
jgi:hypothetical protein